MTIQDPVGELKSRYGADIEELPVFRGETSLRVQPARLLDVCRFLKSDCGFDMLADLSGVDNLGATPRFEVVYTLQSLSLRRQLRLKVGVPEPEIAVDSVTGVWSTADWHEREAYDMLGIRFRGHPDLRRILMWEGYPYHPLRKEFPVAGLAADLPATAVNAGRAESAPMQGSPFVASNGGTDAAGREPRAYETAATRERPSAAPAAQDAPAATAASHDLFWIEAARRAQAAFDRDAGPDRMVINMGPQHPSTHGVLRLVVEMEGEDITRIGADIGYLHRGDEKIAENMTYQQFLPYTDRLDYLAPLANNVAYVCAVEKLLGIAVPPRCQYIRVMCCELARIESHLLGIGCYAMDVGAMTVFLYCMRQRELIMDLCELLSGARYTSSYTRIGGLANDLPPEFLPGLRAFLDGLPAAVDEVDGLLTRNRIFVDRTKDIGVLSREQAIDLGLTGPNLRSSGVDWDLRRDLPYLGYEKFDFEVAVGSTGDCYDRFLVRMEEVRQSIRILRQAADGLPGGDWHVNDGKIFLPPKTEVLTGMEQLIHQFMLVTEGVNAPPGEVYFAAENPKGELGFYIVSRGGGVPHRLKIRSPSFVNLQAVPAMSVGHLLSDMTAILGSLDFVMGECDR